MAYPDFRLYLGSGGVAWVPYVAELFGQGRGREYHIHSRAESGSDGGRRRIGRIHIPTNHKGGPVMARDEPDTGRKQAETVISASDLSLTFETDDGPVHALQEVNLTINKGDFVSFIGPSGCGKTTFLRVLAALEHPTSGEITVNGKSPDEARRQRAYGYVFQAAGLYPWRTIARNIRLPLEIMGYSKADQEKRVNDVLQLVDLEGFGQKFPWQLSGGMQQRASIARALAFDADILLMDEPFGALDEIVRDHLNQQLLELWERTQKTIAFVTHSIPEAVYLSTRIVVMSPRPGRITDVIESPLPKDRPLEIRDTPEFLEVAHRVREGLRAGHAYEE